EITVDKQHLSQIVVGTGYLEFKRGNQSQTVTVFSADGKTSKVYTLHFQREASTKLFNLKVKNHAFNHNATFAWDTYTYDVNSYQTVGIEVEAETFDEKASVSVEGLDSLKAGDNTIRVSVTREGVEPTVYTLNVNRNLALNFDYSGAVQRVVIPQSGYYKIEAWGAQGGTDSHQGSGGKGGYTAGEVYLEAGEELFVTVGGFGDTNAQGFNGGGKAWTNVSGGSYGGGATDIRVGGTGHFNRILVAGGGGSSVRNYTGGYAGGV
uniref:glycine rich domain-containing protein n=2 Tax=Erysipelothrix aquatica TaxID=2683714 RepID=UPI00202CF68D